MKYFKNKGNIRRLFSAKTGLLAFGLMFIIALSGCRKDFEFDKVKNLSWNPDFALPLVNDTITLRKILTQGGVEDHLFIDESGDISILYYFNNDAFRIRPNDLIRLSPVSFSYLHQITQAEQGILSITDLTINPVTISFNLSGNNPDTRVDKLMIKKGVIKVLTNNTFSNDGYLTIRLLNATKNGVPFSFTLQPVVSGQTQTNVDLTDVLLNLSSSPNIVTAEVEGFLKKSGSPVAGDQIRAEFQVAIDTIGVFEGYLGHYTLTQLTDTVRVNVFNNAYTLGEVFFMDPQIAITMVNSIGFPSEVTIENLIAINNATGNTLDIADRLGAGAFLPVPAPPFPVLQPATTRMNYSNENTGNAMYDFFNLKPDNVAFQVKTVINPVGTPFNFFTDTSSFYADLRVKLPLWGHVDHLTYQDTFDLKIDKPEEIEYLEFRTNIINGLPLTGLMQVYFTDDNFIRKDSLAGSDMILIREAPVDPVTYLPYPGMFGIKDTTYILNSGRMKNLENVKKMLVKAVLFSANEGQSVVKLRVSQAIKLNFSARAKLRKTIETSK
ncbi:MAG: hypothetical protein Q8M08_06810 [Bacteroidales bacterium]|nr:hypothetical protein [Bacteroidales bacterium]